MQAMQGRRLQQLQRPRQADWGCKCSSSISILLSAAADRQQEEEEEEVQIAVPIGGRGSADAA
jgi:hypothetical protein